MDIQSKKVLQDSEQEHKLKISREDVLKKLIDGKDVINIDSEQLPE